METRRGLSHDNPLLYLTTQATNSAKAESVDNLICRKSYFRRGVFALTVRL